MSNSAISPKDRLFIGIYPGGIIYADRARDKHGDYARAAFLDYRTLSLSIESDCPDELRTVIISLAKDIQAKKGEMFRVSACGQTVVLGGEPVA